MLGYSSATNNIYIFDREPRSDRGLKTWFFVVVVVVVGGVVVGDGQLSIL